MLYGDYGILPLVIALLQREGRISYRGLKVQFHLQDDALAAIKDELIYARRLAVDEDERVLVWTGGAHITPHPPTSATAPGLDTPLLRPLPPLCLLASRLLLPPMGQPPSPSQSPPSLVLNVANSP